ncbi:TPA: glutamate/gamma-aminobutyrate family transporter YjeM [Clostridium perfringens]|uniref:glutamate/gamma-aminobutyrate family transporter YjeM n=1 Tax=Clostridium perfringens TaxID=1502 RepID=UPI000E128E07|nr:glutamate/gamma-aminobutyrate family transporter YjeM [Clostridium perfringens]EJT6151721.1 glutamate/gamma-aminobutyrate family transporter YjeM [Clostridium perfringens]EJT6157391.1 glutamate/gamma-aminobutyrate family transporter YjeM [Clostridium perfringens]MDK0890296.1 glutamate/gamma-aminobutyrate family transporter YjeM [Clostridium perfringens]UBK56649.1 glutamate/gamma-aminobutyrate family transporter YjeM [Clostridium perfringens]UBK59165.1 glutamate/gamma-aminobutyrate family tr
MESKEKSKLTLTALILMIFTSVYGFTNMPRTFYLMGYSGIIWYIMSAILFFIPYAFMMAEYGAAFRKEKGGIYSWMAKSVNPKFAFIVTFMWFSSNLIWMVSVSSSIWIPLSNVFFGKDTTSTWNIFGLTGPRAMSVLAIILLIIITFISSKGLNKISKITSIGGTVVALSNVVLILGGFFVLASNGFKTAQGFNMEQFIHSPNPAYQSPLGVLGFVVFAIFAYGGIEVVGGLVDQTENPKKNFPKGIKISAFVIVIGYAIGILCIGFFVNWNRDLTGSDVNMANIAYIIVNYLGYYIGEAIGLSTSACTMLGNFFARFIGLSMFLALIGAFFALSYSPLKQLIEGTPKDIWPEKWTKLNKENMPATAMWIQCLTVIIFVLCCSIGGDDSSKFFNYLILMGNVAMTLPYMFLSFAFSFFKKKKEIVKPFEVYKNYKSALVWSIIVTLTVGFANVFTIIQPLTSEKKDYVAVIFQISGPIIFGLLAWLIYRRYENNVLKKQISNIDNKIDTELKKIEKAEEEVTSETIGVIDIEVHDDDSK